MQTSRKRGLGDVQDPQQLPQICQYPSQNLWRELEGAVATNSIQRPTAATFVQQANSDDDISDDLEMPTDAQATVMLLRDTLYPDPAAAAAAATAAKQTRHAKRSRAAPGPSKAAAAAVVAAAAAATAARRLPPLLLKSQLYTVLKDRTAVDLDVEELRRQGRIRLFKLAIGADEFVILLTSDYLNIINNLIAAHTQLAQQQQQQVQAVLSTASNVKQHQQQDGHSWDGDGGAKHQAIAATLQLFRDNVVPACQDSHIMRSRLLQLLQETQHLSAAAQAAGTKHSSRTAGTAASVTGPSPEDMERYLLHVELVCRDSRAADSYMLTVPGAAAFVKSVVAGRQEMLRALQRKKYQEMLENELSCLKLRGSCLTPAFHIRDLQGRGLVTCTNTTAGRLVRPNKCK